MGGTKGKKKVKQGKGSEKKNATKKKVNKATASGSSDGDSSAESSAPEEGMSAVFVVKICTICYKQTLILLIVIFLSQSNHKGFSNHFRLKSRKLLWLQLCRCPKFHPKNEPRVLGLMTFYTGLDYRHHPGWDVHGYFRWLRLGDSLTHLLYPSWHSGKHLSCCLVGCLLHCSTTHRIKWLAGNVF